MVRIGIDIAYAPKRFSLPQISQRRFDHGPPLNTGRALLTAALGFAYLPPYAPELRTLHAWLDSWQGIRWIATAMGAEHQALRLERRAGGWTATLHYVGPTQVSPAAPSGLATAPSPWTAAQWAAWQVLRRDL